MRRSSVKYRYYNPSVHPYLRWFDGAAPIDWSLVFRRIPVPRKPQEPATRSEPESEPVSRPAPRVEPPVRKLDRSEPIDPHRKHGLRKNGSGDELDRSAARLIRRRIEEAEGWVHTISLDEWAKLCESLLPEIYPLADDRDPGIVLPEVEPELDDAWGLKPLASAGNNMKNARTVNGELQPPPRKIRLQGPDCEATCQDDGTPYENTGRSPRRYEEYDDDGELIAVVEELGKSGRRLRGKP